ncbi:MAG TPA: hypothetical protein VKV57_03395 [bacterium]|nr:hypothetical protein [bacterium]
MADIIYNSNYYGCSFHTNRGPAICANGKVVLRARIEQRLLRAIQEELFTPEAVDYLTRRVQEELKRLSRQKHDQHASRHTVEQELSQALQERVAIKDAIRRGLISAITREMLVEVEARIQHLERRLQVPPPIDALVGMILPEMIQELDEVLGRDLSRSRGLLRDLLGEIVLRPTSEGLVAELRGNVEGLLRLEKALPGLTGNSGSGGSILGVTNKTDSPSVTYPLGLEV